jgi:hypothetical protein
MDSRPTWGLPATLYSELLAAARSIALGSLHRLLDLHNRYPHDLPTEAIERVLKGRPPPGEGAPSCGREDNFPHQ